ncbi:unnamed protein product [Trifolium pratense]|uniref:Uncharacterized protein n=1 Tax=Trifolium pratense TaxID=57577 RepID=A0ACB0M276_TRIPR|nr:unnamed protein product [Trifolium pratense]
MNHGGVNATGLIFTAFQASHSMIVLPFGMKSSLFLFIYSSTSVLSISVHYSVNYRKNFVSYFCWFTDILIKFLQYNLLSLRIIMVVLGQALRLFFLFHMILVKYSENDKRIVSVFGVGCF